jgi:hypothetical protein
MTDIKENPGFQILRRVLGCEKPEHTRGMVVILVSEKEKTELKSKVKEIEELTPTMIRLLLESNNRIVIYPIGDDGKIEYWDIKNDKLLFGAIYMRRRNRRMIRTYEGRVPSPI